MMRTHFEKNLSCLIYGINYSPELTGIGKYTGEMAGWLSERGHNLQVVTAPPYYPKWRFTNEDARVKLKKLYPTL